VFALFRLKLEQNLELMKGESFPKASEQSEQGKTRQQLGSVTTALTLGYQRCPSTC
jgi:hypothetical protein